MKLYYTHRAGAEFRTGTEVARTNDCLIMDFLEGKYVHAYVQLPLRETPSIDQEDNVPSYSSVKVNLEAINKLKYDVLYRKCISDDDFACHMKHSSKPHH